MPNALLLLAPGFEETEAITVIDLLRRASIEVTVAGLQENQVTGSHDITINTDVYYKEVQENTFDILILPGGQPGSTHLKNDAIVLDWVRKRFEENRYLAAICAAPTVFHAAGITDNLKLTSFPAEKDVFTNAHYSEDRVVIDQNVITSRGVGTAIDFALTLIEILCGMEQAEDIGRRILHPYVTREK
ncbi:MAG: DJ-1 family protein [Caldithrix sp.]|nr:DJ-1 family protein [Caldithrix sp.]